MSKHTSRCTAACGHPRPRTGVGTLLALSTGGFVTGPFGPGTWQPSRSSTPLLGAWPCLRGASAPALLVQQGLQWSFCVVFPRSRCRPAGTLCFTIRRISARQDRACCYLSFSACISLRSAGSGCGLDSWCGAIFGTVSACRHTSHGLTLSVPGIGPCFAVKLSIFGWFSATSANPCTVSQFW